MSSSTSNFSGELKVLALVAGVLLLGEAAMRLGEQALSRDLVHIRGLPGLARDLAQQPGRRILFVGNSLTRSDVDEATVVQELAARGVKGVHLGRMHPDASTLAAWYYGFKKHFVHPGQKPDVLVVDFAYNNLQDQPVNAATLGGLYTDAADIPEAFASEVTGFGDRVEFLLARCSMSFLDRSRVAPRLFDQLVPHYRAGTERVRKAAQATRAAAELPVTHRRLEKLLALTRANGIPVIFVAMPIAIPYEIDPRARAVMEQAGVTLVDARVVPGLTADSFTDSLHLDLAGSVIFSRHLAGLLAEPLQQALAAKPARP
jgi:hypothetical protein